MMCSFAKPETKVEILKSVSVVATCSSSLEQSLGWLVSQSSLVRLLFWSSLFTFLISGNSATLSLPSPWEPLKSSLHVSVNSADWSLSLMKTLISLLISSSPIGLASPFSMFSSFFGLAFLAFLETWKRIFSFKFCYSLNWSNTQFDFAGSDINYKILQERSNANWWLLNKIKPKKTIQQV